MDAGLNKENCLESKAIIKVCKRLKITKEASDLGIKYLTLYAFSTENWTRPKMKSIIS